MTNREIILGRIREALKVAAPHPDIYELGGPNVPVGPDARQPVPTTPQKWLPPVGETVEEQIELFRRNAEELTAEFHECNGLNEAIQYVKHWSIVDGWKKIGLHSGQLTEAVARELNLAEVKTDRGYAVDDLESCDAGLTECEALIAQTGSVLVSAPGAGGRALSVLPPHHVVLARRSQMVPDMIAAFQRVQEKFNDGWPSFLSFISGPSRTGDIERILVLGAHGPKRLTILLLP